MLTSEQFQNQLLDYLYDLLDEADARAMCEYLESHPEAKAQAERTRQLFSTAARKEFPEVQFVPPTSGIMPHVTTTPAALAGASGSTGKSRRSASRVFLSWAVALCALVVVGVISIPAAQHVSGYVRALDDVEQARQKRAAAQQNFQVAKADRDKELGDSHKKIEAVKTEIASLEEQREKDLDKVREDWRSRSIGLEVTGPRQLIAGAPNDFMIRTKDRNNQDTHAGIKFILKDQTGPLFEQTVNESQGFCSIHIPPSVPIRPGSQLAIEVEAIDKAGASQSEVKETLEWAAPRYFTHLATDKPLYKPGQTVYFRSLTLNRATMTPPDEDFHVEFTIKSPAGAQIWKKSGETRLRYITNDPIGKQLLGPDRKPVHGIAAGEYTIPDTLEDGGEFILTIHDLNGRFPDEQRKFLINTKYTPDHLLKELEWDRKSYGPGAEVTANCKVMTGANQPLAYSKVVAASANVDGTVITIPPSTLGQTDALGCVKVKFKLPEKEKMNKGHGSLNVVFSDGGAQEAINKPIPISLNKLFFEYYAEGGYLVAGAPNRVYYQVRNTNDKPAEMKGHIVDGKGQTVASTETLHGDSEAEAGANLGMGSFRFTPKAGETYKLVVEEPAGAEALGKWPEIQAEGVTMFVPTGVTTGGEPIRVELSDTKSRQMLVGAYCRGRLLDHQRVQTEAGKSLAVELKPDSDLGGVVRVTVFEEETGPANRKILTPRAERLVFRRSAHKLDFQIQADKSRYSPGSPVAVTISATNEKGEPAPAIIMVSVVNDSVLKMADEKTERSMSTHFAIDGEVRRPEDLEHADFLLNDQNPKAATALDLLLGVQGWRRFAEQKKSGPAPQNLELADQLAVLTGQTSRHAIDTRVQREQEVQEKTFQKKKELYDDLKSAVAACVDVEDDPNYPQAQQLRQSEIQQAGREYERAVAALGPYEAVNHELRQIGLPILGFGFLLVAVVCLARAAVRTVQKAIPYYATAVASIAAGVMLLVILASADAKKSSFASRETPARTANSPEAANEAAPKFDENGAQRLAEPKEGGDRFFVPGDDRPMQQNGNARPLPGQPGMGGGPAFGKGGFQGGGFGGGNVPGGVPGPVAPAGGAGGPGLGAGFRPQNGPAPNADKGMGVPAPPRNFAPPAAKPNEKGRAPEQPKPAAMDPKAAAAPPAPMDFALNAKEGKKADGLARGGDAAEKDMERLERQAKQQMEPGELRQQQKALNDEAAKKLLQAKRGVALGMDGKDKAEGEQAELNRNKRKETEYRRQLEEALGRGDGARYKDATPLGTTPAAGGRPAGPAAAGLMLPPQVRMAEDLAKMREQPVPFFFREYSYAVMPSSKVGTERTDFTETVFWHPALVLENGKATVQFHLSDSLNPYRVLIAGHTLDGRIGSATSHVEARKPFSLEAKLPSEMTSSDKLDLPIVIGNDTDDPRWAKVQMEMQNMKLRSGTPEQTVQLEKNEKGRRIFRLQPSITEGQAIVDLKGTSEPYATDEVKRGIRIVSEGFPFAQAHSDLLEKTATHEVELPQDMVAGSLQFRVQIYPSTLADLQKGLEGLLREPGGCFEQTSTSNYPNTLILGYLQESDQANPKVAREAKDMLGRGYQKLVSFECQKQGGQGREGYEWFGGAAPPHEALTAYGLLEFSDMAKVSDVDKDMLARTREYLLGRRKGDGTFERNTRALDTFGRAPQHITNAYIVWSLTETGNDDMSKEIDVLLKGPAGLDDPYFLSLMANSLLNLQGTERRKQAIELLQKVKSKQAADGSLSATETSITCSGGRDLQIETTALAVLAWLKVNQPGDFALPLEKAIKWIGQQRGGYGGFGSTQSTILALKALIAYTKANKKPAEGGELTLVINGQKVAPKKFEAGAQEEIFIELKDPEKYLQPGKKNEVRVELSTKRSYPFTIGWAYNTRTPISDDQCAVGLETRLDKTQVKEGDAVRMTATLTNKGGKVKGQPMTVAIIGLPAGLKVPEDMKQLKGMAELKKTGPNGELESGEISFFELRGRELVLYWRDVKPEAKVEINVDLIAEIPGEYRGPASRAYLYYNADHKAWVKPLEIAIEAAEGQK
jgi:hypothetical protein